MLPVTSFLSCTEPIDQLECFSTRQKHHAKTYVTGLVAASNKTVQGISNYDFPAKSERALNKFLTEYNWDEDRLNRERLALLQQTDDTKWSSDGVVIIDDTFTHKTGEKIPNVKNSALLKMADSVEFDRCWFERTRSRSRLWQSRSLTSLRRHYA